jgi:hypothetical protein
MLLPTVDGGHFAEFVQLVLVGFLKLALLGRI